MRCRPIGFRSRGARVSLCFFLGALAGAASLFGARPYTLERSKVNGSICWECSDGSAGGSAPDRRSAAAAARAACPESARSESTNTKAPSESMTRREPAQSREIRVSLGVRSEHLSSETAGSLLAAPGDTGGLAFDGTPWGHDFGIDLALQVPIRGPFVLDLSLFGGEGRATRYFFYDAPPGWTQGSETVDFQHFGGEVAVRFYPFAGESIRPWIALGGSGSIFRPTRGRIHRLDSCGSPVALPLHGLTSFRTAMGLARIGLDLAPSRRFGATLSGSLDQQGAWSARFGLVVGLGGRLSAP